MVTSSPAQPQPGRGKQVLAPLGDLPEKSGATDLQEKLQYPGWERQGQELKAPTFGSAAHQFLPLQTELLNSSPVLFGTQSVRLSSGWHMCVCLSFWLPWTNLRGAGCKEYFTIPGACLSAGVITLQICGQWVLLMSSICFSLICFQDSATLGQLATCSYFSRNQRTFMSWE